jgi:hypothetical protein
MDPSKDNYKLLIEPFVNRNNRGHPLITAPGLIPYDNDPRVQDDPSSQADPIS